MAEIPERMEALVLKHAGFAGDFTGPVIDRLGDWVEHRRLPVPEPAEGEVLIRVELSPVNPSDIAFIKGEYGLPRLPGRVPGFEGTGMVVAGRGSRAGALVGQRVAFAAAASGSWAQYAVTDPAICVPVHSDTRPEDAAAFIVNPFTALALVGLVAETGSDAVVLTAAGSQLGRLMVSLARDRGLRPLAVIRGPRHAEALRALGAAEVLDVAAPDFPEAFAAAVRTYKPRMLLDAVADGASARMFFAMPGRTRWVCYGKLAAESPVLDQIGQLIFTGKRLEGFWLTDWLRAAGPEARHAVVQEAQARFLDGRWHTGVATTLGLEDAIEQLAPALAAGGGKVMLRP